MENDIKVVNYLSNASLINSDSMISPMSLMLQTTSHDCSGKTDWMAIGGKGFKMPKGLSKGKLFTEGVSFLNMFADYTPLYVFGTMSLCLCLTQCGLQLINGKTPDVGNIISMICGLICATIFAACIYNVPLTGPLMIAKYVVLAIFAIILIALWLTLVVKGNGEYS